MQKNKILITGLFLLIAYSLFGQIPAKPEPQRLVNDFAGLLNTNEVASLEQKLVAFNDSTSTQIVVVIVADLQGYDKAQFAYELGEKWGIGQKGKNNGIVVLIKPKTFDSKGQAFIAPGYGLEGAVPDAIAKRIVESEMIPHFKQNNYYGGIDAAVNTLISLTKGEYTADQYLKKKNKNSPVVIIFIIIFIFFIIGVFGSKGKRGKQNLGSSDIPLWMLLGGAMGSSSRSGDSWGGFSSGSGGFGGFGGGSFGGGGAGGSW
jgi:uncharacterized protein